MLHLNTNAGTDLGEDSSGTLKEEAASGSVKVSTRIILCKGCGVCN